MKNKLETIKFSIEAFNDAFRETLQTQHKNVREINNMLEEAIDHLVIAEDYLTTVNKNFNDIDREEYAYKYGCSVRNAYECFESIQATMRVNPICDRLRMALTGMCLMLKSDISELEQ